MSYTIRVCLAFKRQFKRLSKRYHSLEEDLRQLSESLLRILSRALIWTVACVRCAWPSGRKARGKAEVRGSSR